MPKFLIRREQCYSLVLEAPSPEEAERLAEGVDLIDWGFDDESWDVEEVEGQQEPPA